MNIAINISQSRDIRSVKIIQEILKARQFSDIGRIEENPDDLGYYIYGTSWQECDVIMYVTVFQCENGETEFTFYDGYEGDLLWQSIYGRPLN